MMLGTFASRHIIRCLMVRSCAPLAASDPELRRLFIKAEETFGLSGPFTAEMLRVALNQHGNIVSGLRRTGHPVKYVIRDVLSERMSCYRATGTLVGLFSQLKRTGFIRTGDSKSVRVNHEHVVKAAEMLHMMQLLHNSVMQTREQNDEAKKNWELGNKLAILFGDFFWALAFKEIADIQDTTVLSTFARGIESFAASSFEEIPHCVTTEWWKDFTPRQCSWLPKAFECSLLVAGVECPKERAEARKYGTNLVLALQAREIMNHFRKNHDQISQMSVEEVPVMAFQFGCSTAGSVSSSKLCEVKEQEMGKFHNLLSTCSEEILAYIDACDESNERSTMQTILTCLKKYPKKIMNVKLYLFNENINISITRENI